MKKSVKITLAVLFPAIFAASCILGGVLAYKKYSRKTVDVSATVTEDEWVNAVEKTSLAANFTFDQRNLTIRKNKIPGSGFTNETEHLEQDKVYLKNDGYLRQNTARQRYYEFDENNAPAEHVKNLTAQYYGEVSRTESSAVMYVAKKENDPEFGETITTDPQFVFQLPEWLNLSIVSTDLSSFFTGGAKLYGIESKTTTELKYSYSLFTYKDGAYRANITFFQLSPAGLGDSYYELANCESSETEVVVKFNNEGYLSYIGSFAEYVLNGITYRFESEYKFSDFGKTNFKASNDIVQAVKELRENS